MSAEKEILERLAKAVIDRDKDKALAISKEAVEAGIPPLKVIEDGLTKGVMEVGVLFERGEYMIPFLMMAAEAVKASSEYLMGQIPKDQISKPIGTVVIGTVEGDIHDIGKNILIAVLEASGFKVHDLGVNVLAERFIDEAERVGADIIGLSALMPPTMINQRFFLEKLLERGLRDRYKVAVGGCPTSEEWRKEIGADLWGADAVDSLEKMKKLMKQG